MQKKNTCANGQNGVPEVKNCLHMFVIVFGTSQHKSEVCSATAHHPALEGFTPVILKFSDGIPIVPCATACLCKFGAVPWELKTLLRAHWHIAASHLSNTIRRRLQKSQWCHWLFRMSLESSVDRDSLIPPWGHFRFAFWEENVCWHDALSACAWTCGDMCAPWVFFHSQTLRMCWEFILKQTTCCGIGVFIQFLTKYLWPKQHYLPTSMAEQVQQTADDTVQGLSEAANRLKGLVPNTWNTWVSGYGDYINESHIPHLAVTNTVSTGDKKLTPHNAFKWENFSALVLSVGLPCVPICPQCEGTACSGWLKVNALVVCLPVPRWVQGAPSACQGSLLSSIIVPCTIQSSISHSYDLNLFWMRRTHLDIWINCGSLRAVAASHMLQPFEDVAPCLAT